MEEASEEVAASWEEEEEEEALGAVVAPFLVCRAAPRGLHCMVRSDVIYYLFGISHG